MTNKLNERYFKPLCESWVGAPCFFGLITWDIYYLMSRGKMEHMIMIGRFGVLTIKDICCCLIVLI